MKNVAATCLLVVSLLTVTACATKKGYVAKGNQLFDKGNYAEAALNYRKALQKDHQYGEAFYRLGLTAMKQGQSLMAYDSLSHAVQLLPNNMDAKKRFADVCLAFYLADPRHQQSYYSQLNQIANELLAQDANSFDAFKIKAYLASVDRKPQEAIALFRRALQIDSSDPAVTATLAQNLFRNGQIPEGEKEALNLIARQKTYGPVYDLLYDWYSSTNRASDAENILKTKVANNPKNADFRFQLAGHYSRQKKTADMKAMLQQVLDDPKDFPQAHLWVGDFYAGLQDYTEAIQQYQEGAKVDSKNKLAYRKKTANALLAQGKDREALRVVEQILQEDTNDTDTVRVHAELLLKSGRRETLETAELELLRVSKQATSDAAVWFDLGRVKQLRGDYKAARENYLTALRIRPDYLAPRYGLAEIALLSGDPKEALQHVNELLKLNPTDSRARLLHARTLIASTDLQAARAVLNALVKASPQDAGAQLELGVLALNEQRYEEARAIFSKLQGSENPQAISGLAETYLSQRQFEKGFQILADGYKKLPESTVIQQQYAKAAALTGRYDVAIAEFQKLISTEPKTLESRLLLAEVYQHKGDHNGAIATFRQAEQLSPNDLDLGLALADELTQAGRNSEARTQYAKLVQSHPDNPGALNNAAFFLSDTGGNLDEALKLAQRALEKAPGQPGLSDTIGYIYLKRGQRDSAIQTFSNLVRKYPSYAVFRYHLGLALFESGDKTGAKKELEAALSDHPQQQDARRIRELLDKIS